jgi:hypothetical protein
LSYTDKRSSMRVACVQIDMPQSLRSDQPLRRDLV